jgi:hypothetical protein
MLKVYGERNTGTNYLDQLLTANLEVSLLPGTVPGQVARTASRLDRGAARLGLNRVRTGEPIRDLWFRFSSRSNHGWKHRLAPSGTGARRAIARGVVFVTVTKNPYSWLLSLFDHPYHRSGVDQTLGQFIESPWPSLGREGGPRVYASPVELWNAKNRSYVRLAQTPGVRAQLLTYEGLVRDPRRAIDQVATIADAAQTSRYFENVVGSTKDDPSRGFTDYRDYYLNERWRERLSPGVVQVINETVDRELMAQFDYALIDASN